MSKRLKSSLIFVAGILIGIFGTCAFNRFFSKQVDTPLAYLSWRVAGRSMVFDCSVRFQDGVPADGLTISFLSDSGWTPSECINGFGQAYVHSGERDVQAVRINNKVIWEWPTAAYWIGFPTVRDGMCVDIILKNKEDWFKSASESK